MLGLLPDAVCLAMCALAAGVDVRRYEIPNWLTLGGAAAGLVLNTALAAAEGAPLRGLVPSLAGGAALLAVAGVMATLGVMGMGDVKLLAAAGTLVRWPLALRLLLFTALAGGAVALVLALARGVLRSALRRLPRALRRPGDMPSAHRMPYGLAIALGALLAVLSRSLPLLRFP